jgi:hypothetical protein
MFDPVCMWEWRYNFILSQSSSINWHEWPALHPEKESPLPIGQETGVGGTTTSLDAVQNRNSLPLPEIEHKFSDRSPRSPVNIVTDLSSPCNGLFFPYAYGQFIHCHPNIRQHTFYLDDVIKEIINT